MRQKIDLLALEANFIDAGDVASIQNLITIIKDIDSQLPSSCKLLKSLLNQITEFIQGVINGVVSFETIEERFPEFINFLLTYDRLMIEKVKDSNIEDKGKTAINRMIEMFSLDKENLPDTAPVRNQSEQVDEQAAEQQNSDDFLNDKQLFIDFITEARDHLAIVEESILELENDPGNRDHVDKIFRAFHTIKGVAMFLKLNQIGELSHTTENVLDQLRSTGQGFSRRIADVMFKSRDIIMDMIDDLETNMESDVLSEGQYDLDGILLELENLSSDEDTTKKAINIKEVGLKSSEKRTKTIDNIIKVDYQKIDNLINYMGELLIAQSLLWNDNHIIENHNQDFLNIVEQIKRISSDLQKISLSMRMVPIKQTFAKMQRIIRDLSHKLKKDVQVVIEGEETELDRSLIESINDPMVHLVRNAIDHGLEPLDERKKRGKPETGTICLRAYHRGNAITIEVIDDGRGLNKEKLLEKAREKGIKIPEDATDKDIYQLIMAPGFSTTQNVSDVSGRGVGMDVVRENVEKLSGRIEIQSLEGEGTTIIMRIPLTLAIILGMITTIGRDQYIIPVSSIIDILRPKKGQIHSVEHKNEILTIRGQTIPIVPVYKILQIQGAVERPEQGLLIVVEHEGQHKALMVDDIIGKQEVVIKSIHESMNVQNYFSGCSILGSGKASLILNLSRFYT